jgi:ribonucleoside-diphosphate reductase alpha chain
MAQSIMDYVFRRLALDYLDFDTRSFMGIHTAEERQRQLETGSYTPAARDSSEESDEDTEAQIEAYSQSVSMTPAHKVPVDVDVKSGTGAASARAIEDATVHSSAELMEKFQGKAADAPMCMTCGTKMRPAGSCYVCEGCGSTSGCS